MHACCNRVANRNPTGTTQRLLLEEVDMPFEVSHRGNDLDQEQDARRQEGL